MKQNALDFDALILAGGRSSRLGGTPKQGLVLDGATLLERCLAASSGASSTVVVGPNPGYLPPHVLSCREQPEFAGPAAAVAAGLTALAAAETGSAFTLVLACDMPFVGAAVEVLLGHLGPGQQGDGAVACEDGRIQFLAGIYRTDALKKAVLELQAGNGLVDSSMRSLLASLDLHPVTVPAGSSADVDTWDDAAALGIDFGGGAGAGPAATVESGGRS